MMGDGGLLGPQDWMRGGRYEAVRADALAALIEHKRPRRLALGSWATLVFESRLTAWFQLHEELRFHPSPRPGVVDDVLARANLLVPAVGELTATLLVDGEGGGPCDFGSFVLDLAGQRLVAGAACASHVHDAVHFLRFVPDVARSVTRSDGLRWPPLLDATPLPEPLVVCLREQLAPMAPAARHRTGDAAMAHAVGGGSTGTARAGRGHDQLRT